MSHTLRLRRFDDAEESLSTSHPPSPTPHDGGMAARKPKPASDDLRTVQEVVSFFIAKGPRSKSAGSQREKDRLLGLFAAEHGGKPLAACKPIHLQLWIDGQQGFKSNWTKSRANATIQRPFNWCQRLGLIDRNPFVGVRYRRGRRGRDLTEVEFRALLRIAQPFFKRILLFCRYTGCRPAELRTAKWSDLHIDESSVILAEHKTADTAEEYEPRRLVLMPCLIKMLAWVRLRQTDGGEVIFRNAKGGIWTKRNICKHVQRLRERAGLPDDAKLYGCRHAFGTNFIVNGGDLAYLAALLGHRSVKTTQIYVHLAGKTQALLKEVGRGMKKG